MWQVLVVGHWLEFSHVKGIVIVVVSRWAMSGFWECVVLVLYVLPCVYMKILGWCHLVGGMVGFLHRHCVVGFYAAMTSAVVVVDAAFVSL